MKLAIIAVAVIVIAAIYVSSKSKQFVNVGSINTNLGDAITTTDNS